MTDALRPARFSAPAGRVALLICPGDGMMCVGRTVDGTTGRGELLFAGRRPDGGWPSPQGWLPNWLTTVDQQGAPVSTVGTAGVDDSGWRVGYGGVVPSAQLGTVYGRGDPIGTWIGGPGAELSAFWLEDSSPDRIVNLDPALFIPGLNPAIAPVSTGPGVYRVPAIVTGEGGREAQGSILITSAPNGTQTTVIKSGRVVSFAAGQWQFAVGYGGAQ